MNLSTCPVSSSPVMVSNVYTIRAPPSLQRYREEPTPPPTSSGGSLVPGDPTVAPCYLVLAHSLSFPLIFEVSPIEGHLYRRQASSHHPKGLSTGASVGSWRGDPRIVAAVMPNGKTSLNIFDEENNHTALSANALGLSKDGKKRAPCLLLGKIIRSALTG